MCKKRKQPYLTDKLHAHQSQSKENSIPHSAKRQFKQPQLFSFKIITKSCQTVPSVGMPSRGQVSTGLQTEINVKIMKKNGIFMSKCFSWRAKSSLHLNDVQEIHQPKAFGESLCATQSFIWKITIVTVIVMSHSMCS